MTIKPEAKLFSTECLFGHLAIELKVLTCTAWPGSSIVEHPVNRIIQVQITFGQVVFC